MEEVAKASSSQETQKKVLTYQEKVANCNVIAKPMASQNVLRRCLKLARLAMRTQGHNIIIGLKDVQKAVLENEPGIVLIAGDVKPLDVICHLPALCEQANIPYMYVPSRIDLGHALKLKSSITVLIKCHQEYEYKYFKLLEKILYSPFSSCLT